MKLLIKQLLYTLLINFTISLNITFAQCDNEIISTFPPLTNSGDQRNNLPERNQNPERTTMRNTFNWMFDDPLIGMTEAAFGGVVYPSLNAGVFNPFVQNGFPLKPSSNVLQDAD